MLFDYYSCFSTIYTVRYGHVVNNPDLVDFIQVDDTGFIITWDNKLMMSFIFLV